jgi:hypothetical protein
MSTQSLISNPKLDVDKEEIIFDEYRIIKPKNQSFEYMGNIKRIC